METLDRDRCEFDENGLITHYDGQPIDEYLNRVLEDRAKLIENKIADGSIRHEGSTATNMNKYANANVVCTSVSIDRQDLRVGQRFQELPE